MKRINQKRKSRTSSHKITIKYYSRNNTRMKMQKLHTLRHLQNKSSWKILAIEKQSISVV